MPELSLKEITLLLDALDEHTLTEKTRWQGTETPKAKREADERRKLHMKLWAHAARLELATFYILR